MPEPPICAAMISRRLRRARRRSTAIKPERSARFVRFRRVSAPSAASTKAGTLGTGAAMTLRTVRVPAGIEDVFKTAEEVVSRYFRERTDDPEHGTIEISGERYILLRGASLSVEFFALVRELYGPGREAE